MRALAALGTRHRFILYAARPPVIPFTTQPLDVGWPVRLGSGIISRSNIAWLQYGVAPLMRRDGIEVFWGTRHVLPRNAPHVAKVATIHDFWHVRHPEQQPRVNRILNSYVMRATVHDADLLAAVSHATADDARLLFPEAAAKVRVIPWGVDAAKFARSTADDHEEALVRLGVSHPYILAMDVYNPRKNFESVLRAAAVIPSRAMIVGLGRPRATASEVDVVGVAAALGLGDRLVLPGDVSADDLEALYTRARAFVYPSVYEGFGMPVLEAMAAGAPVLTSSMSSLPEVAGDAAITIDPTDVAAFARTLERLLTDQDLRARLSVAGRARAREFTWERAARGLLSVFDEAHELRGGPAAGRAEER